MMDIIYSERHFWLFIFLGCGILITLLQYVLDLCNPERCSQTWRQIHLSSLIGFSVFFIGAYQLLKPPTLLTFTINSFAFDTGCLCLLFIGSQYAVLFLNTSLQALDKDYLELLKRVQASIMIVTTIVIYSLIAIVVIQGLITLIALYDSPDNPNSPNDHIYPYLYRGHSRSNNPN